MKNIIFSKSPLLTLIGFLLLMFNVPQPARAGWPPFRFEMTPALQQGKIVYTIKFAKQISDPLADVAFKIPLPPGTRFLEASAQPTTAVAFDGAEVTFFTAVLHRPIQNASFVVEISDPRLNLFTTHAYITWKGSQPGDYLTDAISLDLTQSPLTWTRPRSRLRLEAGATVAKGSITYLIYPKNVGERRMWDVKINIPLPAGVTLLATNAPPPFTAAFDGREVSFSALELARRADVGPLTVQVSTAGLADTPLVTHAWATWKNVGRRVGQDVEPVETARSGDIAAQPNNPQQVIADPLGDVPISNYDVSSITLSKAETALKVALTTVENLEPAGSPLEFMVYIDSDCRPDTGARRGNRGAEFWVRYRHTAAIAKIYPWDTSNNHWSSEGQIDINSQVNNNTVTVWIPDSLLGDNPQFCWVGRARNRAENLTPGLPNEWVGVEPRLTQFNLTEPER